MRTIRGFGTITQNQQTGWRTFHSLQFSFNRRFSNGLSFGFNDTWSLYDHQSTARRFDHASDGSVALRADQAEADRLLGTTVDTVHLMRGNFVWDLPDVPTRLPLGLLLPIVGCASEPGDLVVEAIYGYPPGTRGYRIPPGKGVFVEDDAAASAIAWNISWLMR